MVRKAIAALLIGLTLAYVRLAEAQQPAKVPKIGWLGLSPSRSRHPPAQRKPTVPLARSPSKRRPKEPFARLPTALRLSRPVKRWDFRQAEKELTSLPVLRYSSGP